MNPEQLLRVSIAFGQLLLESGAETTRVEQTVSYVLNAYKVEGGSAFATPTGLFVSFDHLGVSYSKTMRVRKSKIDLDKINRINHLSRNILQEQLTLDDLNQQLSIIKQTQEYPMRLKVVAGGGVAMFFALLNGVPISVGFYAFFMGCLVSFLNQRMEQFGINFFVKVTLLSSMVAFMALSLEYSGLLIERDPLIIATLLNLVPGVAITNAIRDTIAGDLLSGITRATEATLIAVGLAIGAGFMIIVWHNVLGVLV